MRLVWPAPSAKRTDATQISSTRGAIHPRWGWLAKQGGRCAERIVGSGHLFQKRFGSVVMDDAHLATAFLYVALNPVRARLITRAADWRWASTAAHLAALDDGLVDLRPLLELMPDFAERLADAEADGAGELSAFQALRSSETTGRPAGNAVFIAGLERLLGRALARRAPGRKPMSTGPEQPALF